MKDTTTGKLSGSTCIVVPCYNEEGRLPLDHFARFLWNHEDALLCFVNDGSSDGTERVLKDFQKKYPDRIVVVSYTRNAGKAEAVLRGMQYGLKQTDCEYLAYLDADLATAPEECYEMTKELSESIHFVFGSRIMKIGSVIDRRPYRFLVGRVIATFISKILKMQVYDTQCGCKVFTRDLAAKVFTQPFVSRWLFDVEIFQRCIILYGRDRVLNHMLEIPLRRWTDVGESKIKFTYFFKLWLDLYRIKRRYASGRSERVFNPGLIEQ